MNFLFIAFLGVILMTGKPEKFPYKYWNDYDALFKKYAAENGIDWQLMKAIALNESTLGQSWLVENKMWSSDGKSRGLMQLTVPTANDFEKVTAEQLDDAETSIRIAAKFLKQLTGIFQGNTQKIVMSYNQGAGNTLKGKLYAVEYFRRWENHYKFVKENN